jgi:adenine-specific DNA-methyltransferase
VRRVNHESTLRAFNACFAFPEFSALETPNMNLWCHVLFRSLTSLKRGGRIAAVLPQSLVTGLRYRGIFDTLIAAFEVVTVITLPSVFETAQQNIALFLGDNKDVPSRLVTRHALRHVDELAAHLPDPENGSVPSTTTVDEQSREVYEAHRNHPALGLLGDLASLKNGYVTGANPFFHITESLRRQWELPDEVLTPALFRASGLAGLELTKARYQQAKHRGAAGYLLTVDQAEAKGVEAYLRYGVAQGLHQRYKCRKRTPWYAVPQVLQPRLIVSYMSGSYVKAVVNTAKVVVPNTFHGLDWRDTTYTARQVALAFYNPLTMLSAELEGHSLGGGVLKLEP